VGAFVALAWTALGGGAAGAAPPIDPGELEDLAPPPDSELDDATAEELFATLGQIEGSGSDASSLTGPCGGVAFSYDSDGTLIDAAYDAGTDGPPVDLIDGGQAFTDDNRFQVDTNGSVSYYGFAPLSGEGPMDYTYELQVAGITVDSGDEANSNGNNRNAGTIDLSSELPFPFDANIDAGGTLKIAGATYCAGDGKVEFVGNGIASLPGLIGLGLAGVGVLGVFINARPARTWKV
jgi:hypothetical protein